MAQFNNDDLEYVVDDFYDMADFEEDHSLEVESRMKTYESLDSDDDGDDFDMVWFL